MGPVGAVRHIRCAQLPQNPFCLCLDVLCRQGLAAQMFLSHQINKPVQNSGVAVQGIPTPDGIGVVVGDGLCPFLVAGRVAPIPVLELDGVGKDQHDPVHAVGLDHALGGIVTEIHPVEVFPHRSFNGLLALEIGVVGGPVLLQLPMLFRIGSGVRVNGGFPQLRLGLASIIGPVLNAVPDHIHVAGLQLLKVTVHIGQRCGRIQEGLGLGVGQLQFLHRHHDVLPDGVLIGVVQNFLRGLAFQPVPVFVLLSGHLLIEGRIQIVGIHVITPPFCYMKEQQGALWFARSI